MSAPGWTELEGEMRARLTAASFNHSLRTGATAVRLAQIHGADERQAGIAGLVHDAARDLTDAQLLEQAEHFGLKIDPVEAGKPYLLHSAIGAKIVALELGIEDAAIVSAVAKHTFGDTYMNKLDRIVYLADVIEPGRACAGLDEIRRLAQINLDDAFKAAYKAQLISIIARGGYLHPRTLQVWNHIASEVNGDGGTI
ncbi:MAG: bis(5'-nucleosyl)-tetraphosphatase (symmetrical) YqeK [Actinomycetota bacterium]|nr:bis(5'-nucleosyl)-tetraphosphatase (symmetrical) YqeK [Actinomycetota bacterium]